MTSTSNPVRTPMELASSDWQMLKEDQKPPTSLVVQLRRTAHVFPYFRLAWVEGGNDEVKIVFTSHLVTVTGFGLAALIAALAGQLVVRLILPSETEVKFNVRGVKADTAIGPGITDIVVSRIK